MYTLHINGQDRPVVDAWVGESLLYVLRERLELPGAKGACEQGECGSCTVLMDGDAVCSCLVMAATAVGSDIVTVEGLIEQNPTMAITAQAITSQVTDVQQAFIEEGGVQCGFCTPGLIVAVHHLLDKNPDPTELEVKESISGNICRCTGYGRIFAAVEAVVQVRKANS
ncbi:MAG: (2Fe-2S)-binding protein [Acidimicrobiia bacterium BACL6 MAG-120924-bin43]|uniref:(2Fe-2S)-binding protein n=1 Tax=Acidimicrobiia bacterium BACL6 MAG-120924-bin43 TaxID=1655583 RepID=A0A0R2QE25_9ACTN|nr:MAG: (2Fe-2S)-binding protein [Acidimicrobiia bacterium BACL6 MAG-120924-bin43]KRO53040.1 MAG: (2Fe-2S)-binding protein [Acidimicrobiia bacterium BACL6 MAG-120910-bin40]KRO58117.1 MAG: (2Fe-2S)-binding protein [Acidimicrobiia bacterium BACL6 MAG-120322-bin79]HAG66984.1 (2Fe-2S)-binding protein [Acidimicrobium sp.]